MGPGWLSLPPGLESAARPAARVCSWRPDTPRPAPPRTTWRTTVEQGKLGGRAVRAGRGRSLKKPGCRLRRLQGPQGGVREPRGTHGARRPEQAGALVLGTAPRGPRQTGQQPETNGALTRAACTALCAPRRAPRHALRSGRPASLQRRGNISPRSYAATVLRTRMQHSNYQPSQRVKKRRAFSGGTRRVEALSRPRQ